MLKLLRNFPILFGVVSVMQLRMLSITVFKLLLDQFMLANLLQKFVPVQVQYVFTAFRHQVDFLYRVYKCIY